MSDELSIALRRYTDSRPGQHPYFTDIEGLIILRANHEKAPSHIISKPALCIVAQGEKWTSFGENRFHYRPGTALVVTVEMPSVGRVVQASPDAPFLGAVLEFDPAIMRSVMEEAEMRFDRAGHDDAGAFAIDFGGMLADCMLRLIRLLDRPGAAAIIAPMIKREICYWLLEGSHGRKVAQVVLGSDHSSQVVQAIHHLRERFHETVSVDELASIAMLSSSAFHRQFKHLTSLTPLQYQKQLRLMEARRLMMSEGAKVETAAYTVGYESPSQFSREYSRMFGTPPKRDAATASWSSM